MKHLLTVAITGLPLIFNAAVAHAQSDKEEWSTAGTLTCSATTTESITEPVLKKLDCQYEPASKEESQTFEGEIIHHAPNVTIRSGEMLVWTVWKSAAISTDIPLIGKYFGLREDDPTKPGTGANTLIGQDSRGVLLEPVVNANPGDQPNMTLEVTELELKPAST